MVFNALRNSTATEEKRAAGFISAGPPGQARRLAFQKEDVVFDLKSLDKSSVEAALEKAVRYRLLNEPEDAESICRDVLAIAFGAMVGWSWVVLAGEMIVRAGALGSVLALVVGAVMVWLVGLTYAELTSALPRAGGEISFTFVGLGPTAAFICGWTLLLAYVAVCAFEAVALPTVASYLAPGFEVGHLYTVAGWDVQISWVAVGVAGAISIGIVNYLGIR
ncbi:MAG: APC family permease, partial [Bacteroidetes bacterium]|nr:APC family permease [Bacteroidota bacterium]